MAANAYVNKYAVWRIGSNMPSKYYDSYEEAETEAKRLASKFAAEFIVVKVLTHVARSMEVVVTKECDVCENQSNEKLDLDLKDCFGDTLGEALRFAGDAWEYVGTRRTSDGDWYYQNKRTGMLKAYGCSAGKLHIFKRK